MSADEYWKRGNSFYGHEGYQEAVKEYVKALSIDPRNHRVWHILGLAYANSGELPDESLLCRIGPST
ncbi:MAG: tetratricopeptide repeat protein [Candidatus Hodarchaeota archaeon]